VGEGEEVVAALQPVGDLGDEAVQVMTQRDIELHLFLDDLDHLTPD
jgi:hypothetical protein